MDPFAIEAVLRDIVPAMESTGVNDIAIAHVEHAIAIMEQCGACSATIRGAVASA